MGQHRQQSNQRSEQRPQQTNQNRSTEAAAAPQSSIERQHGSKTNLTSITQPRRQLSRAFGHGLQNSRQLPKTCGVVFFDTLAQAKADLLQLKAMASKYDQLNIVVRAEGSMEDPDLNAIGRLFCGAAWTLIHERRRADGWYPAIDEA
jgi:hypothetical protein